MKNFSTARDSIRKMKRQATDWKKIFASHIFDKGLVSRTYQKKKKQLSKPNSENK